MAGLRNRLAAILRSIARGADRTAVALAGDAGPRPPGGPPEHWLRLIEARAPGLLIRSGRQGAGWIERRATPPPIADPPPSPADQREATPHSVPAPLPPSPVAAHPVLPSPTLRQIGDDRTGAPQSRPGTERPRDRVSGPWLRLAPEPGFRGPATPPTREPERAAPKSRPGGPPEGTKTGHPTGGEGLRPAVRQGGHRAGPIDGGGADRDSGPRPRLDDGGAERDSAPDPRFTRLAADGGAGHDPDPNPRRSPVHGVSPADTRATPRRDGRHPGSIIEEDEPGFLHRPDPRPDPPRSREARENPTGAVDRPVLVHPATGGGQDGSGLGWQVGFRLPAPPVRDSVPAGHPWPPLPDDSELWVVPTPARFRTPELDTEQAGSPWNG